MTPARMRAPVLDGAPCLLHDYPVPEPGNGEVRVRVRRAGICNTDLEILRGYQNFSGVIGHEFVGETEDGRRVVGEINTHCGECGPCSRGDLTHCDRRTALGIHGRDGALADFLLLPVENLHEVPDAVTDRQAVFVEPLAAAVGIIDRIHVRPSDRVLVAGDGKLGLLVAQVLQLTGCDLVALGHHPDKLSILERRGIRTLLGPPGDYRQYDIVVECTGKPEGFDLALRQVRPRGTIVCKSTFHGPQEVALSPLVVSEVTVVGSRCGPFRPALRLLEQHLVDVDSMVTAEYMMEECEQALRRAAQPGSLKVQVVMRS
ncbi:MAG: MDR/zinc-dependent alcohol dehydrogenase-like family protein [Rudaea sp.]